MIVQGLCLSGLNLLLPITHHFKILVIKNIGIQEFFKLLERIFSVHFLVVGQYLIWQLLVLGVISVSGKFFDALFVGHADGDVHLLLAFESVVDDLSALS